MKKRYLIIVLLCFIFLLFFIFLFLFTNPIISDSNKHLDIDSSLVEDLEKHVRYLAQLSPARSVNNLASLNQSATYIFEHLGQVGCDVGYQDYTVDDVVYKNVLCSFNKDSDEIIVLGAHYDVHEEHPGADDNASGVAGIIEIAKKMGENNELLDDEYRYDIVAFTLEEWPYFRTPNMGSNIYVEKMLDEGKQIKYLVNLEMIGYFSDEPGSQNFPIESIKKLYGDVGDFIAVIGRFHDSGLTRAVKKKLQPHLKTKSLNAPANFPGIDRSDHQNFRAKDISAVMITDTSFYRNKNYHTEYDTVDTLNYEMMSRIVEGVADFILTDS